MKYERPEMSIYELDDYELTTLISTEVGGSGDDGDIDFGDF